MLVKVKFANKFLFPKDAAEDAIKLFQGLSPETEDIKKRSDIPEWWLEKYDLTPQKIETAFNRIGIDEVEYENSDPFLFTLTDVSAYIIANYEYGYLSIASEHSGIEFTAMILSDVMEKHNIQNPVTICGAYYTDNLYPDMFGAITAAIGPNKYIVEDSISRQQTLAAELVSQQSINLKQQEKSDMNNSSSLTPKPIESIIFVMDIVKACSDTILKEASNHLYTDGKNCVMLPKGYDIDKDQDYLIANSSLDVSDGIWLAPPLIMSSEANNMISRKLLEITENLAETGELDSLINKEMGEKLGTALARSALNMPLERQEPEITKIFAEHPGLAGEISCEIANTDVLMIEWELPDPEEDNRPCL